MSNKGREIERLDIKDIDAGHGGSMAQTDRGGSASKRNVILICAIAILICAVGASLWAYIRRRGELTVISLDPAYAVVSVRQSMPLTIWGKNARGEDVSVSPNEIDWTYSKEDAARIENDNLVGLRVGHAVLRGKYRNQPVEINVDVTEPVEKKVSVALNYPRRAVVSVYAGDGTRERADGSYQNCMFISPGRMDAGNDAIYVVDSGEIRELKNGMVSTLPLSPSYLRPDIVRCGLRDDPGLYILSGLWEGEDGLNYYSLVRRLNSDDSEFIYTFEANQSLITDFVIYTDGNILFIQKDLASDLTALYELNPEKKEIARRTNLPKGASSLAYDRTGTVYIAAPEQGVIMSLKPGQDEPSVFAGVWNERHFADGKTHNFYYPVSLAVYGDSLYVFDFNVVRRVVIQDGKVQTVETMAGVPTTDSDLGIAFGAGDQTFFPASQEASLVIRQEGQILFSDPKNSVIYEIAFNP